MPGPHDALSPADNAPGSGAATAQQPGTADDGMAGGTMGDNDAKADGATYGASSADSAAPTVKAQAHKEFDPPNSKEEALSFDSEHLLRTENIPFDIDNWCPSLAEWTFETAFLPLSRPEARAIVRYHWLAHLGRRTEPLPAGDVGALEGLEARIDAAIDASGAMSRDGCFMRLCGRSPKDADPLDRARVRAEYDAALRELAAEQQGGAAGAGDDCRAAAGGSGHRDDGAKGASTPDTSEDRSAAQRAVNAGGSGVGDGSSSIDHAALPAELRMRAAGRVGVMRCRTGADVMALLLSSERVYSDMLDWLWYGEPEQVVLRAWEPELSLDHEFRLYVHRNRLCAVSQYDHYTRYDHLFTLRPMLQRRFVGLWERVHPLVGVESYCVDLAYLPRSDRVVLLELSPFLRCTGAHCFRWSNPRDVDVLEGRAPFEFRLVEKTHESFSAAFAAGWDSRWAAELDATPFWRWYQTGARRRRVEACRDAARWLWRAARKHPNAAEALMGAAAASGAVAAAAFGWAGGGGVGGAGDGGDAGGSGVDATAGAIATAARALAVAASVSAAVLAAALLAVTRSRRRFPSDPPPGKCRTPALRALQREGPAHALFVYGTLKRGLHWHAKFLSHGALFVGEATTVDRFPLVVGRCGVPYLLHDCRGEGERVAGELFYATTDTLQGLDQYEGTGKTYYERPSIDVTVGAGGATVKAGVYVMSASPPSLRALPAVSEYTREIHDARYRPVEHIQLKQRLYLRGRDQYTRRSVKHPDVSIDDDAGAPHGLRPLPPLAGA